MWKNGIEEIDLYRQKNEQLFNKSLSTGTYVHADLPQLKLCIVILFLYLLHTTCT